MRDDDYRLSFAYGNFATLSNVKERDIARILEYRLSPLYISVHATPWEARKVLLNNPEVPNIVEQLTRLADGGIQFHCQMVIVPGLNDGDVLEQSLGRPLGARRRGALGGDRARSGSRSSRICTPASRWTASDAGALLAARGAVGGARARASAATRWVYGSDELYLLAGRDRCRTPSTTATSRRSRTASAPWRSLRQRVRGGRWRAAAARWPAHRRRDRRARWRALMPPLLDAV